MCVYYLQVEALTIKASPPAYVVLNLKTYSKFCLQQNSPIYITVLRAQIAMFWKFLLANPHYQLAILCWCEWKTCL